jgi:hypothetical protein
MTKLPSSKLQLCPTNNDRLLRISGAVKPEKSGRREDLRKMVVVVE